MIITTRTITPIFENYAIKKKYLIFLSEFELIAIDTLIEKYNARK